jgi:hypothetical protein
MSCPVPFEVVPCFELLFASFTFEVPFVTVSSKMLLQLMLSLKQLATFWTFKLFSLAVSDRVQFQTMIGFECFFTLSALEVPRCLVIVLIMIV